MRRYFDIRFRCPAMLLLATALCMVVPAAAADAPWKVAVVPFKINAERNLAFLQSGINDMLASRLSWEDKVLVIPREETMRALGEATGALDEIQAQIMGAKLGVDFVLYGSLTVFGESVSIDARMVDVAGEKPTLSFFNQSEGMNQVIPKINQFATDINGKVFGRQVAVRRPAAPAGPAAAPGDDLRAHPEKLLSQGVLGGGPSQQTSSSLNPAFISSRGRSGQGSEFWKSQNFKQRLIALAVADTDGDGGREVVVATAGSVQLGRVENGRLSRLVELEQARLLNVIGIDAADINGNGVAEIFVSALAPQRNGVRSFVLEYRNGAYRRIVDSSRYIYRVAHLPGRGPTLLGQRFRSGDPFRGDIYEMVAGDAGYQPGKPVLSARVANLMGMAYGDVMNSGDNLSVAYNASDRIRVLGSAGEEKWAGSEALGGTNLVFLRTRHEPGSENNQYLPMRLLVKDLDADGKHEVIAVRNHEVTGRKLSFRKFTAANIESMVWDGLGLGTNWSTRKISGQISDFAVGDFDNDGEDELVATVISKEGRLVGTTPKSSIIAYDLKR